MGKAVDVELQSILKADTLTRSWHLLVLSRALLTLRRPPSHTCPGAAMVTVALAEEAVELLRRAKPLPHRP
jgi:hypothetical protein